MIKWNKSEEGYCSSKCGRFEIEPFCAHRSSPIGYHLYYRERWCSRRVLVTAYADTQWQAKEAAERFLIVIDTSPKKFVGESEATIAKALRNF